MASNADMATVVMLHLVEQMKVHVTAEGLEQAKVTCDEYIRHQTEEHGTAVDLALWNMVVTLAVSFAFTSIKGEQCQIHSGGPVN